MIMISRAVAKRTRLRATLPCIRSSSRCFSQNSRYTELPPPSWSISSLELDKQHEPVTRDELSVLAKRALISLPMLDSMNRTDELRQDLGNMLQMIRKVQGFAAEETTSERTDEPLTEADIYDRPRGVHAAPVRDDEYDNSVEEKEAKQVWESFLKPKTTAFGAHSYFVIATKKESSE